MPTKRSPNATVSKSVKDLSLARAKAEREAHDAGTTLSLAANHVPFSIEDYDAAKKVWRAATDRYWAALGKERSAAELERIQALKPRRRQ
ncbi:MAG: hypothetical protein ACHREM_20540 [Polyangiales bacterium]